MQDELKTAGVVALAGGALGAGVALGLGLRFFTALAMVGLGTGIAIGVLAGSRPQGLAIGSGPQPL